MKKKLLAIQNAPVTTTVVGRRLVCSHSLANRAELETSWKTQFISRAFWLAKLRHFSSNNPLPSFFLMCSPGTYVALLRQTYEMHLRGSVPPLWGCIPIFPDLGYIHKWRPRHYVIRVGAGKTIIFEDWIKKIVKLQYFTFKKMTNG